MLFSLLAGGVSCAAVQGGLLAGLVSRQQLAQPAAAARHGPRPAPAPAAGFGDDLAPVGGFLAGKLLSHTMLGVLLGLAGTAVQLSVHVRTMVQLGAGVLIIAIGLGQLGVRAFTGLVFTPPASWTRLVRGRARSQSALAPAVLGLSSILIEAGVTLSVMALAVASGSPWQGALIMAVFVVGTAPLFTLLGYAAARAPRRAAPRRAAGAWRKRLAVATGLVVLALGGYTLNGGLELTGSPSPPASSPTPSAWPATKPPRTRQPPASGSRSPTGARPSSSPRPKAPTSRATSTCEPACTTP